MNGVVKVTGLSYPNVNRLITKFQELDILHQMDTYQRNRRFIYADYLAMFAEEVLPGKAPEKPLKIEEDRTQYLT